MISETLKSFIGRTGEPRIFEVEKGAIKRYADAIGETNLLYWDDEYARDSRYGSIIAPPGFFGWPARWTGGMPFHEPLNVELRETLAKEGFSRIFDAGMEYEFYRPVWAGDTLESLSRIAMISEKEAKAGKMFVISLDTTFTNQNGGLVARVRKNMIAR